MNADRSELLGVWGLRSKGIMIYACDENQSKRKATGQKIGRNSAGPHHAGVRNEPPVVIGKVCA